MSILGLLTLLAPLSAAEMAQAVPNGLRALPTNVCQKSNFYQVKTPNGEPLVVLRKDGDRRSLAHGTTVMLMGEGRKGVGLSIPRESEPVWANSLRHLVQINYGSKFNGKMRVKTLDSGGYINVRKEPTVWGANEKLVVGSLREGTSVSVQGAAPNTFEFYYVTAPNGIAGYVASSHLVCQ